MPAAPITALTVPPIEAPINLSEADLDLASGLYGDLDADTILLEFAPMLQAPYVLAGVGLAMGVLCGLTFARLVQERLNGWKQDRLAMLPLGCLETNLPYAGIVIGITLFIGGSLQVFGFASGAALLVAFLLSVATAGALWVQLERLMLQVENGTFSAVDFDNFDQFF
ncbi:MAG: hypothetical protein RLZZ423_1782 [Cyanobacteriota bacterium]